MTSYANIERAVRREYDRIGRIYAPVNRARTGPDWLNLIARRFGNLAQSAVAGNGAWVSEELIKLAATAMCWLAQQSDDSLNRVGKEGVVEIDRVGGPFPRMCNKRAAPPEGAQRVADAERVWIGGGGVWVEKKTSR